MLEPICRGTACSGDLLYRYDEQGRVGSLGGSLVEVTPHYAMELFHVDPIQGALFRRKHMPHAVVPRLFLEIDWTEYRRGAAYSEFYEPHGMEDLLGLTLSDEPYGTPNMSGLVLTRSGREPQFQPVRQVDKLRPALLAAVRRIERIAHSRRREATLEAAIEGLSQRPTVIVDRAGRTLFLSRQAELLLNGSEARSTFAQAATVALSQDGEQSSFLFTGPQGSLHVEARAVCSALRRELSRSCSPRSSR